MKDLMVTGFIVNEYTAQGYGMSNAKLRPETRFDKSIMLLVNNAWQGCMSLKITFNDMLEEVDIEELRELIDA